MAKRPSRIVVIEGDDAVERFERAFGRDDDVDDEDVEDEELEDEDEDEDDEDETERPRRRTTSRPAARDRRSRRTVKDSQKPRRRSGYFG